MKGVKERITMKKIQKAKEGEYAPYTTMYIGVLQVIFFRNRNAVLPRIQSPLSAPLSPE